MYDEDEDKVYALVINGHSLVHALHTELEYKFVELCTKCKFGGIYFYGDCERRKYISVYSYTNAHVYTFRQSSDLLSGYASAESNGGAAH